MVGANAGGTDAAEQTLGGRVAALLRATPDQWAAAVPPVVSGGSAVAPLLLQGLQRQPDAPGAQAAIAVLGQIGDDAATPFLMAQVERRGETAVEAALALGALRTAPAVDLLMATMQDHLADATLRTACACALVALGNSRAAAPFVHAVLLADTPSGQALQREHGLAPKGRWALERYLLQRTLRSVGHDDFGLDPDLPWPTLQVVAAQIVAQLEGG